MEFEKRIRGSLRRVRRLVAHQFHMLSFSIITWITHLFLRSVQCHLTPHVLLRDQLHI